MKIGIDIQATAGRISGLGGGYTKNLIESLAPTNSRYYQFFLYNKREGAGELNTLKRIFLGESGTSPASTK